MALKVDLGLLGGLDSAVQGAIQGYEKAQDRKLKEMEMAAKLKSDQENKARQAFDDKMKFQDVYGFMPENQQDIYDKTVISQDQVGQYTDPETGMLKAGFLARPSGILTKAEREQQRLDNQQRHEMTMEDLARERIGVSRQALSKSGNNLPLDVRTEVTATTNQVASRRAIANDLEQGLKQLKDKELSEDERIIVGRELLKTLNSSQGKDAIGAEEAARLGSLLEYKIGNFTDPGSFVGRDLNMFTEQVSNNLNRLKGSLEKGTARVDELMGRQPKGLIKKEISAEDKAAIDWAKKNSKDPRAKEILQLHGM